MKLRDFIKILYFLEQTPGQLYFTSGCQRQLEDYSNNARRQAR